MARLLPGWGDAFRRVEKGQEPEFENEFARELVRRAEEQANLHLGQRVVKDSGDYRFEGEIVAIFLKRSNIPRIVVENDDGMLFIFNPKQLRVIQDGGEADGDADEEEQAERPEA